MDCARCHTPDNWLVDNVTELHQVNGFPLLGAHATVSCFECHTSETALRFDRIGNDCVNCHLDEFNATTNPSHPDAGFSTNCVECHDLNKPDWGTETVNHDFFPLTKGHETNDCAKCHSGGEFANTPTDCFACHQPDFESSLDPNHPAANLPTDCKACHTTDPGWMPAEYSQHDGDYFPIYSGSHNGEWNQCSDCHLNNADYGEFSCIVCHINPQTGEEHDGVENYVYENSACLACHPTGNMDDVFDHNSTNFPLTGAHTMTECTACHTTGYEGTPSECAACHTVDFEQTTNPNHQDLGLATDCASCHTTDPGWMPATFDNHNDFFALNGAHADIAGECVTCHNGDYNNTPNTCTGCHTTDFNEAMDPNHVQQQFPMDCASCHSETDWSPSTFDHNDVFPFTGAHVPVANDCIACHTGGNYANTPNTCAGCHTQDFDQSTNPNHGALNLPNDCAMCHTTEPDWMPAVFPIHNDFYVLNGAHAIISNDCAACHNGDYNNTPNTCFGCHADAYNNTTSPNHQVLQFSQDCATCHTASAWVPAAFDHDSQFFPIYSGTHNGEWNECMDCHINLSNYAEFTCTTCHANPETDNEHNGINGYSYNSPACLACHPTGDADNVFDHNTTNFPLTGVHLTTGCIDCHGGGYQGTPTDCAACHTPDFNQSTNPNHVALGFPTDCASCHTTQPDWAPASFAIHDDYYVLNGAHAVVGNDCATCHNGDYNNTPNTCFGCHSADYNQVADPNHQAQQFPVDCETCHSESAWVPSTFDHNSFFPFTGAHVPVANDCIACHAGGNYANTPNTCAGCHTPDYNQSANPNHMALGLPNDCAMCHTTEPDWMPAAFPIHDDFYVLNGAHAIIANDCAACHNGDYNNTPNTCYGCHAADYNGTVDPNHVSLQFSQDCQTCHSESAWLPSTFDHDGQYFPIYSGAHNGEWNACMDCHVNLSNYAEVSCTVCHTNPETDNDHNGVNGYSYNTSACLACHPTGDADNIFDHNTTSFPLTGVHLTTDCLDCHATSYQGTPTDCAACHTPNYNQSTNPNHVALGIPTDCASCHTTEPDWEPATFQIHNNYYALNGAHAAISNDCAACHNGNYNNTPNTCFGCHSDDYNNTANPNHQSLQFSTDCATCHSESAWVPSTFDHDGQYFPIYSGEHNGEWNQCTDCHINPSNYAEFSCTICHTNPQTDNEHAGVNGYSYNSTACLACHPTGDAVNIFNHGITNFPLTGAHISTDCIECHAAGYQGTPMDCAACHTPHYNQSTNPNHVALGIPMDCATCHSTEPGWSPATFAIHDNYYVLDGAHTAVANDCVACHAGGNYNNTPNTCAGCHTPDYNQSTNPNHVALGIPTDCADCHTTEPDWEPAAFPIHHNYYALNGAHAAISNDCAACHNGNYNNTPNTCFGCHSAEYNQTTNPNHAAAQFPTDCASCHTASAWTPSSFDHNSFYALNGAHAVIANDCMACHAGGNYSNTPNTCFGCHENEYNQTTNPNHVAAQLPTSCDDCHSETAWAPATFDHNGIWPFTGAHIPVANDCAACHVGGNYSNTPNTCAGCHTPDYNGSTNPNHVALGIPTDCDMCHTTEPDWMPATFPIHNNYYVLNGAHAVIANDCAACHNGNYNNTPNTCFGCHSDEYNQTTNPDHQAAQFPTDCLNCHTESAWSPSTFDHNSFYALNGAHAAIANDCVACHAGGNYSNTPNTCFGCHENEYNQTTNPNHVGAQLPTACDDCHSETAWTPATFDHSGIWPFTGAHIPVANDCAACHIGGNYSNTPNTCAGCHTPDYNGATNPNHVVLGIPTDCDMCHTTEPDWMPATFPIHNNYYALNGAHATISNDCAVCHNGNYNNTPNTCFGCHSDDYNQAADPNHVTNQLPTNCEDCHSESAWVPSTFDHNAFFPFTGAHIPVANDCAACHIGGNYSNTPNDCAGCHTPDYNGSTNPNHVALSIPTDCAMCHTTDPDWMPATFPIHNNYYQLNGAHAAIANDCVACHNGNYNNTPNTCFGCHATEYNSANNPNHVSAGFPTTCENCHSENAWSPSTFDHDGMYFPIYSGKHEGEWNLCADCHIQAGNFSVFSCIDCHEHDDPAEVGQDHQGVSGYVYSSPACYSCHPTGED